MSQRNEGDRYMDGRSEKGKKSGEMEATGGKDTNEDILSSGNNVQIRFYLCEKEPLNKNHVI